MGYNPVVTSDGVRWRDYELAAESPGPARARGGPSPKGYAAPDPQRDALLARRLEGLLPRWPERLQPHRPDAPPSPHSGGFPPQWSGREVAAWARPDDDWFDDPRRPVRLDASRSYGTPGGLAWPDPQVQEDLCQAVPGGVRFPDPRGAWIRLVNGEGPSEDPFRATNSLDCALAVVSTWHGEPAVAAPRQPEYNRVGMPSLSGETGGVARAERWLGHRFEYAGQGRRVYAAVARRLEAGGHGSAAVLITRWPSGGSHAWNAVNAGGEVVWVDAQRGHTSVDPPAGPVTGVFCVVLDRRGRRL